MPLLDCSGRYAVSEYLMETQNAKRNNNLISDNSNLQAYGTNEYT